MGYKAFGSVSNIIYSIICNKVMSKSSSALRKYLLCDTRIFRISLVDNFMTSKLIIGCPINRTILANAATYAS